jgi:diguanylate cyclase (GGDEF)-like protein
MNLTEFLGRQNKAILVAIGVTLLAIAAFSDHTSGPDFDTSVLYLLPVSFFAAFLGRRTGLVVSLVCAIIALHLHRANNPHIRAEITYWNALVWLALYVFFVLMISQIRNLYRREQTWSRTDALTGIANRRAFFETLEVEKNRARRYNHPLTLAYIDVDHFKKVNDTFGHQTGDKLLILATRAMKSQIRMADFVARLGGDEFVVLLPETDENAAAVALSKLQGSLNAAMEEAKLPVTFSIGAVIFQSPPVAIENIISIADQAMYMAQKSGKGKLVIERAA